MAARLLATMVTTTSYGTWLPGDLRGYGQHGVILPPNPRLLKHARSLLTKSPVYFNEPQQHHLFEALQTAAGEFGYRLSDAGVESWHLHWIVSHGGDSVKIMVGRLKTRMRQAVDCGRIWTKGYCARRLYTEAHAQRAREYIARHAGCRMIGGKLVRVGRDDRG